MIAAWRRQPWAALAAAWALAALLGWWLPREAIDWRPELAASQPWRAATAAFVHWTPLHLAANLAGCAAVAVFGVAARLPLRSAQSWAAAWPLTQLGLLAQPALERYGGLSGVLHAGVAIGAWHLLRHERGARRAIGAAVAAGLVIKLGFERPWAAPMQALPGWDFALAPAAHLSGALAGLACALIAGVMRGSRQ